MKREELGNAVANQYEHILGRKASPEEAAYWADSGKSFTDIMRDIVASQEYQDKAAKSDKRFVYGLEADPKFGVGLHNNPNFKEFLTDDQLFGMNTMATHPLVDAPLRGTAYDPMSGAWARGASHQVDGVELIPGAKGYDREKAAPFMSDIGKSLTNMSGKGPAVPNKNNAPAAKENIALGGGKSDNTIGSKSLSNLESSFLGRNVSGNGAF